MDGLKIVQEPWPLLEPRACADKRRWPKPHVPLPMPYGFAFMQAESGGRRVEIRVCKYCGTLYYHCWEVSENSAPEP